mmetsp:Transcript_31616/g.76527  ORF Transcript_31616/g.76527 Transcript_31616/m.76527 type:complete len:283 (-) Transcript_31616:113-961(-)
MPSISVWSSARRPLASSRISLSSLRSASSDSNAHIPASLSPASTSLPFPSLLISSSSSLSLDAFRAFVAPSLLYSAASLCEASFSALYRSQRSIRSPSRWRIVRRWERMASSLRRSASSLSTVGSVSDALEVTAAEDSTGLLLRLHALDVGADEVRLKWLLCGWTDASRCRPPPLFVGTFSVIDRGVTSADPPFAPPPANTAPPTGILVPLLIEGLLSSMIQAEQRVCITLSPPRSELESDDCNIMDSSGSNRKCCAFVTVAVAAATHGGRSSPRPSMASRL